MTDQERIFGLKARQLLDLGTAQLAPDIKSRLAAAREQAMAQQRVVVSQRRLAGTAGLFNDSLGQRARMIATLAALALGMAGTYIWTTFTTADENADTDAALLADDLPVEAYSDQGFHAWLDRSKSSEQ